MPLPRITADQLPAANQLQHRTTPLLLPEVPLHCHDANLLLPLNGNQMIRVLRNSGIMNSNGTSSNYRAAYKDDNWESTAARNHSPTRETRPTGTHDGWQ